MSFLRSTLIATAIATMGMGAAMAATATATFDVLIKINPSCTVTAGSGSNIDFGAVAYSATNLSMNNNITVLCTKNTAYTIGLLPASGDTGGAGNMAAQNVAPTTGNTDKVPYTLRSVSATGTAWGNVSGKWVPGTGIGANQTLPVYATVPSVNVTPDSYKETVTVTVTY